MTFYLGTLTGVLAIDIVCDNLLKKRLKEKGYISKSVKKRFSVMSLINFICLFVPLVNNLVAGFAMYITIKCLHDDEMLERCFNGRVYSSESVKKRYERDNIEDHVLEDMFTLDGADEETKNTELKKIADQKNGYEDVDLSILRFGLPTPDFSDEEYEWACVEEYAKQLIDAINLDTDLSFEDREKLMKYLRNICKSDFEGKEVSSDKVEKKLLKIVG